MAKLNYQEIKSYLTLRNMILILLFLLPIIIILVVFFTDDSEKYAHIGTAPYQTVAIKGRCPANSREGDTGAIFGESSLEGVKFNLRTPLNYDPTIKHPLIIVYAPAGANRTRSEKLTNLTYIATSAGYIIAYVDHPELSPTTTIDLGSIAGIIEKKWCIDSNSVYLTGHSDGGTVSMALAFMAGTKHIPAAIAASAAGINELDLRGHDCPGPIPVMVMHSAKDRLFPGYGIESSGWWAACNNCDPIPEQLKNGCIAYNGCDENVSTWYCEGDKPHSQWPDQNSDIIEFFNSTHKTIQ